MDRRAFLVSAAAAGLNVQALLCDAQSQNADPGSSNDSIEPDLPLILPVPELVEGVAQPFRSLDGEWEIATTSASEIGVMAPADWKTVIVPGQADLQGVILERNRPFVYRKNILVPSDFSGKRVFLRFEGVSGTAEPFINHLPLTPHRGGFTIWDREITQQVAPGSSAELLVQVTDPDPHRWTSGFDYGGICRSVRLLALPRVCISRLQIDTDLDQNYRRGMVRVTVQVLFDEESNEAEIECGLLSPSGRAIIQRDTRRRLNKAQPTTVLELPLPSPELWDAEHPRLYTLEACLRRGTVVTELVRRSFGIRKIEIVGNKVLVNGMQIKLRGGGRFDSDPLLGHTLSVEQCVEEVRLLKEGNLNYIRPACYPASEAYLEACDKLGMYVEGENSVTFTRGSESDAALGSLFLSQMAEMIEANRNHPCILHWSLGNESNYGINIERTFRYARQVDPLRPVLFSWSHGIPPAEPLPYTIFSFHYPTWSQDLGKPGVAVFNGDLRRVIPVMPVLHDEFAHGPCYDHEELLRDPNVHNFWGESIRLFWERMFTTEGCLGGGIWAAVDDLGRPPHVYRWGMLDLWRRQKPEYWLMKKAYSPVRIEDKAVTNPGSGNLLRLPIKNWHDHTHLSEITVSWSAGEDRGTCPGPHIVPHGEGILELPARAWRDEELLHLRFLDGKRELDVYALPIGATPIAPAAIPTIGSLALREDAETYRAQGESVEFVITKNSGMLSGFVRGERLLVAGPSFHLVGARLSPWQLASLAVDRHNGQVEISIIGSHGLVEVRHDITLAANGTLQCRYTLLRFPLAAPETQLTPWNETNAGGFSEVGLSFLLSPQIDRLRWDKKGLYSVYPDDHIGRNKGEAARFGPNPQPPGIRPDHPWFLDEPDQRMLDTVHRQSAGTNDFLSMKEYIREATIWATRQRGAVLVTSQERDGVRLEIPERCDGDGVRLIVNNQWNYTQLGLGNYMKPPILLDSNYTQDIVLQIVETA